jgi:hypothetical protein
MGGTVQYDLELGPHLNIRVTAAGDGIGLLLRDGSFNDLAHVKLKEPEHAKALIRTLQRAVDFYEEEQE